MWPIITSVTRWEQWVVLWKLRIGVGLMQLHCSIQQKVMMSACYLEQFRVFSSRYGTNNGRHDSLQVEGTPHSYAIVLNSWARNVWFVLRVSSA